MEDGKNRADITEHDKEEIVRAYNMYIDADGPLELRRITQSDEVESFLLYAAAIAGNPPVKCASNVETSLNSYCLYKNKGDRSRMVMVQRGDFTGDYIVATKRLLQWAGRFNSFIDWAKSEKGIKQIIELQKRANTSTQCIDQERTRLLEERRAIDRKLAELDDDKSAHRYFIHQAFVDASKGQFQTTVSSLFDKKRRIDSVS